MSRNPFQEAAMYASMLRAETPEQLAELVKRWSAFGPAMHSFVQAHLALLQLEALRALVAQTGAVRVETGATAEALQQLLEVLASAAEAEASPGGDAGPPANHADGATDDVELDTEPTKGWTPDDGVPPEWTDGEDAP